MIRWLATEVVCRVPGRYFALSPCWVEEDWLKTVAQMPYEMLDDKPHAAA